MLSRASKLASALLTRFISDSCEASEREKTIDVLARLRGVGTDLSVLEMLGTGNAGRRLRVLEACAEANIPFAEETSNKLAHCLLEENIPTVSSSQGKQVLCKFFQRGNCKFGKNCRNAHGEDQLLCKEWMQGSCKLGSKCKYTHGKSESLLARALRDGKEERKSTAISYNVPKYLHENLQAKAGGSEHVDRVLALLARCQPSRPAAGTETVESIQRDFSAQEELAIVRASTDSDESPAETPHAHEKDVVHDCDPVPHEGFESPHSDRT